MGMGLVVSSTNSTMSMKRVELAMTLCEQRMGLSCTSKVKQGVPVMFIGGLAAMARAECSGIFFDYS